MNLASVAHPKVASSTSINTVGWGIFAAMWGILRIFAAREVWAAVNPTKTVSA